MRNTTNRNMIQAMTSLYLESEIKLEEVSNL